MVSVITDVFKSFEVEGENGVVRIDEGDKIKFTTENGEVVEGVLMKISGKGEKTKIQIIPNLELEKEEIWSVLSMVESSLEVIK